MTVRRRGRASAEQRGGRRVPFQGRADLVRGTRTWATRIVDLSTDGSLLVLPFRCSVQAGDAVSVDLHMPGPDGPVQIAAVVVHHRSTRVGVRFRDMSPVDAQRLRALVGQQLGDARLAERRLEALAG